MSPVAAAERSIQRISPKSDSVSWAYLLSGAVATLLLGRFGDIYGKKRVMIFAHSVYCVGLIGCAVSWSMGSLIVFRAVQGVGMGVFVLAFGIIRDTFPGRLIPVAIGLVSAMFFVGVSIGLLGEATSSPGYHGGTRSTS